MQALHMTVSPTYNEKLGKEGGRIDRLLRRGASNREIIEEFYLAALSRFPNEEEQAGLERLIQNQSSRREALEDLLWAVICSRDFFLQGVLATEERSGFYGRGSMFALEETTRSG